MSTKSMTMTTHTMRNREDTVTDHGNEKAGAATPTNSNNNLYKGDFNT